MTDSGTRESALFGYRLVNLTNLSLKQSRARWIHQPIQRTFGRCGSLADFLKNSESRWSILLTHCLFLSMRSRMIESESESGSVSEVAMSFVAVEVGYLLGGR